MLDRWDVRLTTWRRWLSRSEWIARVLGNANDGHSGSEPGLVLVQIDGLSRRELERAIEHGRMPFVRRMLHRENYRLHGFYSGLPATTFAVQAELFYGLKTAVPAVGFRIRSTGQVGMILDPQAAEQTEADIASQNGQALLAGGSAYADALHGGAAEPHFCAAALTLRSILGRIRPHLWPVLLVLYFPTVVRIAWDSFAAIFGALADAWRGVRRGQKAAHEFKFVRNRLLVDVVLREWQTYSAQVDATRGLPIIHVNYLGYDEKAHRRGPKTAFAHRSLRSVDRAIRRIWSAAERSPHREYEVWIYGDHGQEQVAPYPLKAGRTIEEAVAAVAERFLPAGQDGEPPFEMAAIGPVGYFYPRNPLDPRQCAELAKTLIRDAGIPAVLTHDEANRVFFQTVSGRSGLLPEQAADLVGSDHPYLAAVAEDLVDMCRHPEAGPIVLLGWCAGEEPMSFAFENGAHGGPGPDETAAFVLLPRDVPAPQQGYFRGLDLRRSVLQRLGRTTENAQQACAAQSKGERRETASPSSSTAVCPTIRLVTYNVHSCVGLDGKVAPQRIARVIAQCDPDVVALQELDVGRRRTRGADQAEAIARELKMTFHFHAAIRLEEEQYGDAILSRLPMRLVRSGLLPAVTRARPLEPRGALWVAITAGDQVVQVINTHLGLTEQEQLAQVNALLGPDWLGHPECREPVIVCGDMNFGPRSRPFRLLASRLNDVQLDGKSRRPARTFPSRLPIVRIDHIFVKGELQAIQVETPRTRSARRASDHLPLVADLHLRNGRN